jgi:hypothetical protein
MLSRLETDGLPRWERNEVARLAIHHLGDDERSRNASWACAVLVYLDREALPRLEAALDDRDYQRRQYAAELLRWRDRDFWWGPPEPFEPSDRLLEVSLEALRDDHFERYNAHYSFEFLLRHREGVVPMLSSAIQSDDLQQEFLAAVLAGLLKAEELAPLAAPVLVSHLQSNTTEGDARMAAPALLGLGEAGRAFLLPAVNGSDPQARMMGWAIIKTMDHQPLSAAEHAAIKQVTDKYTDLRLALEKDQYLWDWYGF